MRSILLTVIGVCLLVQQGLFVYSVVYGDPKGAEPSAVTLTFGACSFVTIVALVLYFKFRPGKT